MLRAVVINLVTLALIIFTLGISTQEDRINTPYYNSGQVRRQSDSILFPTSETTNKYQHFHHFHDPNFHDPSFHDPNFHHHHHHHYQSVDENFPKRGNGDESSGETENRYGYGGSSRIPLALIQQVNNYTDVNDLLANLVEGDMPIENRFGDGERSASISPKAAGCMPELQTIKIVQDEDPSVLYIPSCTRIERCGGCCSHNLLSCQPMATETVNFQVVKTQFTGGSKFKFIGKEIILVEKHTKCKCDCKIQEKDCTRFQEYRKNECRCACTNTDEEKKCFKDNSTKLWNPDVCACQCRNIAQCSTGYRFDTFRCKCGPISVRRRFADMKDLEKTSYDLETEPEVPDT